MTGLKTEILYLGDNLEILPLFIPSSSVDLIYLTLLLEATGIIAFSIKILTAKSLGRGENHSQIAGFGTRTLKELFKISI